jgi:hypothetical protein
MRDARVQRDVGLEELGDRTTRLGLGSEFLKPGVVGSRNLRLECQVDGGDGEAVAHLVKRDLGGRLHALGSETRLAQNDFLPYALSVREDLQSAWLEWFDNRKGKEPDTKLADFKTLLKWAGNSSRMVHADEGPPLKLSATQIRDLHKLHYFRNQFAHYALMGWAIEKAGLPRIVLAASETAEHLMLSYFRVRMHLSGNQIRRIERAAKAVRVALG